MIDPKIFDILLEPIFILDGQKRVLYCNEPAANLSETSARKILRTQQEIDKLFSFSEKVDSLESIANLTEQAPYQEVAFTTATGKKGIVQIAVQPIELINRSEKSWLVFFRDVTLEESLQRKYRAELKGKEEVILDLQKAQAELQNYSRNLEQMVEERTFAISRLNKLMKALLDSLGQGFLIFDKEGNCLEIASKACEDLLETSPRGQIIWNVLGLKDRELEGFRKWMLTLFAEMLPFEDLAPLGPRSFKHSKGKNIQLEYYPLRDSDNKIEGVVVVATDITNLVTAQREAETERAHAKMILNMVRMKRQFQSFAREAQDIFASLNKELTQSQPNQDEIFRALHTLKGGAASFSIAPVAEQAHLAESKLSEMKNQEASLDDLRLSCRELDQLFSKFLKESEPIIGTQQKFKERWIEAPLHAFNNFDNDYLAGTAISPAFNEIFLMEEVGEHFNHFDQVIQSVAERVGKKLGPLQIHNGSLKILPEAYERLFTTFIHAFRNAVDHGIENPDVRLQRGKSEAGTISVRFNKLAEETFEIRIIDDGQGIDPEKIRAKLQAKSYDCSKESDEEVIQHVFDSQFSTSVTLTETSGRGVGMDAILIATRQLGGKCWVESVLGEGTTLVVRVPYCNSLSTLPLAA